MTAPAVHHDDPMVRLRYYRDTGQPEEAQHYERYLRETGQYAEAGAAAPTAAPVPKVPSVAPDATSALARNREHPTGDFEATAPALAANLASAAQVIPGMERLQASARSAARQQPYSEALSDMRHETDRIPAPVKLAGKALVAAPFAAVLPSASAASSGAAIGGADQLLSADEMSPEMRAARTAAGAVGGGVVGKGVSLATTAARALFAKNAAQTMRTLKAARSARATPFFDDAARQGATANLATPEVKRFLAQPDIAEIVTGLKQTRQFANVPEESYEMLDAIQKTLSDQSGQVKRGLEAVTPNKPNIGRFRATDIRAAKDELLDVMSGTPARPGPVPAYRHGVSEFAQGSRELEAAQQGANALKQEVSGVLPSGNNADRQGVEGLTDRLRRPGVTPAERQRAAQGVLGQTKTALSRAPLTKGRRALFSAPDLLHATGSAQQQWIEAMQNLGLLTAGSSTP